MLHLFAREDPRLGMSRAPRLQSIDKKECFSCKGLQRCWIKTSAPPVRAVAKWWVGTAACRAWAQAVQDALQLPRGRPRKSGFRVLLGSAQLLAGRVVVAHFGGEAATHPKPRAERPQGAQNPDIGKLASMVPLAWLHVKIVDQGWAAAEVARRD